MTIYIGEPYIGIAPYPLLFETLNNHCNATSDTDKAKLFNTFFHSVFTGSSFSLPDINTLPMPPSCIMHYIFEVFDALSSLNPTKLSGCDSSYWLQTDSTLCLSTLLTTTPPLLCEPVWPIPHEWKCHSISYSHLQIWWQIPNQNYWQISLVYNSV